VVKMADLLLNRTSNHAPRTSHIVHRSSNNATATLSVSNGRLWIETDTPVAAFEVTLSSNSAVSVSNSLEEMGFTCLTRTHGDITRLVGYSMNNATIPVGTTAIAHLSQADAHVLHAVLADSQADEIDVIIAEGGNVATDISPAEAVYDVIPSRPIYDLQGRMIGHPTSPLKKGVYIVDGKKVFIK